MRFNAQQLKKRKTLDMSMLKQLSDREKRLLYITVLTISMTLLYLYCIEPLWIYWQGLDSKIERCTKQLSRNKIILSRASTIATNYGSYEKKLKFEGSDQEKTAQILKEIENSATQNGVHINDIKPQQIKDKDFYKFYVIELEAESDIVSLSKFIYDLQISQQALRVTRIQTSIRTSKPGLLKTEMLVTKILIQ